MSPGTDSVKHAILLTIGMFCNNNPKPGALVCNWLPA
jgi:hypothetical protein